MPINLTLCTLCDKFNFNGPDSFWQTLFCCFRRKRRQPEIDAKQDERIIELEAEIAQLRKVHDPSKNLNVEAGSMIAVYPYPDGSIRTLVNGEHITESDITILNHALEYIVSSGPNLKVFNREHAELVGQKAPFESLPASIKTFLDDMIDATFRGVYVDVITQWEHRLWHFHTHPIYNKHLREGGEVIGIMFITEPYNKPLMHVNIPAPSPIPIIEQVDQHGSVSRLKVRDSKYPSQPSTSQHSTTEKLPSPELRQSPSKS